MGKRESNENDFTATHVRTLEHTPAYTYRDLVSSSAYHVVDDNVKSAKLAIKTLLNGKHRATSAWRDTLTPSVDNSGLLLPRLIDAPIACVFTALFYGKEEWVSIVFCESACW